MSLVVKKEIKNDEVWTTLDGVKIPISELPLGHAHNIIRMLMRRNRLLEEQINDAGLYMDFVQCIF